MDRLLDVDVRRESGLGAAARQVETERTLLGAQVEVPGVGGGELRQQVRGAGEAGRRRDAHGFLYAEGVVLDARLVVREGDAAQRQLDACGEAVERRGQHVVRESLGAGREVENRRQLHRQRHGAVERQCGLRAGQAQRVGVLVGECEVGDGGDAVQTVDLEAHGALRDGGFGPDFARADPEVVHRGTDAQRVARQVGGAHGIAVRGAFVTQAARYFVRYFECAVHGRLGYAALGQPEGQLIHVLLPARPPLGGVQHPLGQILPELVGGLLDSGGQLIDLLQPAVQLDDGGDGGGQVRRHHRPHQRQQDNAQNLRDQADEQQHRGVEELDHKQAGKAPGHGKAQADVAAEVEGLVGVVPPPLMEELLQHKAGEPLQGGGEDQ